MPVSSKVDDFVTCTFWKVEVVLKFSTFYEVESNSKNLRE